MSKRARKHKRVGSLKSKGNGPALDALDLLDDEELEAVAGGLDGCVVH
jgi:hypothetical protein